MMDGMDGASDISLLLEGRRRGGRRLGQRLISICRSMLLILTYYTCSICLVFYQKQLFKEFKFPLTVVLVHLMLKFILASICRRLYTCFTGQERVTLTWDVYWKRVLPPGAAAGIDIGLSQWSLEFITVTLYTMSKSTALLFILFFAVLFKLEEMSWSVVILVLLIAGGLFMFTYKYTHFNLFGFGLVLLASLTSGLRWTLSQKVMQKAELNLSNPIDMVYHIQPWMTLSLLPLAVVMESSELAASQYGFRYTDLHLASWMWARILFGAFLAFLMEVSEYLVVTYTSSLTFSISGVAKEIATLSLAVYVYHEVLTTINKIGLVLCIIGISVHVIIKSIKLQAAKSKQTASSEMYQSLPLLSDSDGEDRQIFTR